MDVVAEQRLMVKTARLYYEKGLNQSQIGSKLGLSRQRVQRLLSKARKEGIVHILINPVSDTCDEVEEKLENVFGLRQAVIVETSDYEDQAMVTRELGAAAASYLLSMIQSGQSITISWGETIREMVNACFHITKSKFEDIEVFQGLGGLGDPNNEVHATELTRRLSSFFSGRGHILSAPGLAGTQEAWRAFMSDPFVVSTLGKAAQADIALMSIGAPRKNSVLISEGSIVDWRELANLKKLGAVGDVNLRYFDRDGNPVQSELNSRVIGLDFQDIRSIKTVIGVAGGHQKVKAVCGAVRGNFMDVLITDDVTAGILLSEV